MLGRRSKSTTGDFTKGRAGTGDILSSVSALEEKLNRLNKFTQACDEAGLADDFKNAALSAHTFTAKCLAFVNARGDSDEATRAIVSQYKEATSNLITLANSANMAGINLHGELREVFETMNELMRTMGLAQD
jgi:hypothetical protein